MIYNDEARARVKALSIASRMTKELGGVLVPLNADEVVKAAEKYYGFVSPPSSSVPPSEIPF